MPSSSPTYIISSPLRPQLLRLPRAVLERVQLPARLVRVAQVRLLHRRGDDDDDPEVLERHGVVVGLDFLPEGQLGCVESSRDGLAWRWVLEGAYVVFVILVFRCLDV